MFTLNMQTPAGPRRYYNHRPSSWTDSAGATPTCGSAGVDGRTMWSEVLCLCQVDFSLSLQNEVTQYRLNLQLKRDHGEKRSHCGSREKTVLTSLDEVWSLCSYPDTHHTLHQLLRRNTEEKPRKKKETLPHTSEAEKAAAPSPSPLRFLLH